MGPLFTPFMTGHGYGGHGGRGYGGRGRSWPGGPPPWTMSWGRSGPFGAWNFPFGGPRGRAGRGDVRAAVLLLLAEQPRHGYDIITELVERSEGRWQPSPGSVYPVLKRLAAEGLVRAETEGERRVFHLTETGLRYVEDHADELGEPWAEIGGAPESTMELLDAARQAAGALWQVAQAGDPDQLAAATDVLGETRRQLYRILAGDALDDETTDPFVRDAMDEAEDDEEEPPA
jgi:DNA-binding PadR family transcriptional regulator